MEKPPKANAQRCRFRIPRPVEILRKGGETEDRPRFLGYAANLSETGMFVQCATPRSLGTRFTLRLHLPGVAGGLTCREVEVIWARGYGGVNGPPAGMGTRFVKLDPPAAQVLRKFLDDPQRAETACTTELPSAQGATRRGAVP